MTVMAAVLRRSGATMVERHGRLVAADFGSAASEVTVCLSHVGLAERSDRATFEVHGPADAVDRALEELTELGERAWWNRVLPDEALVRCEGQHGAECAVTLRRGGGVRVVDISPDVAAVDLVGPLAEDALAAAAIDDERDRVTVVRQGTVSVELIVPRADGPALWTRLLEAGEPLGLACVGLDALDHLAVSEHVVELRRPVRPRG
jgi:glycine cleavage system aminomethyltransferase T